MAKRKAKEDHIEASVLPSSPFFLAFLPHLPSCLPACLPFFLSSFL
jgi:hypothetical protein